MNLSNNRAKRYLKTERNHKALRGGGGGVERGEVERGKQRGRSGESARHIFNWLKSWFAVHGTCGF